MTSDWIIGKICDSTAYDIPYFFRYKIEALLFQNASKNLDPLKEGSRSLEVNWKENTHIMAEF